MKKLIDWIRQYRETGEAEIKFEIGYGHLIAIAIITTLVIYQCSR